MYLRQQTGMLAYWFVASLCRRGLAGANNGGSSNRYQQWRVRASAVRLSRLYAPSHRYRSRLAILIDA